MSFVVRRVMLPKGAYQLAEDRRDLPQKQCVKTWCRSLTLQP